MSAINWLKKQWMRLTYLDHKSYESACASLHKIATRQTTIFSTPASCRDEWRKYLKTNTPREICDALLYRNTKSKQQFMKKTIEINEDILQAEELIAKSEQAAEEIEKFLSDRERAVKKGDSFSNYHNLRHFIEEGYKTAVQSGTVIQP